MSTPELQRPASATLSPTPEVVLDVDGMHCASCVAQVTQALKSVDDVIEARVNLLTNQATISYRGKVAPVARLVDAVQHAGFSAKIRTTDLPPPPDATHVEARSWRNRTILAALGTLLIVASGWLTSGHVGSLGLGWALVLTAAAVQVLVGGPYIRSALSRLRFGSTNMDSLVALGTTTAFLSGAWQTLRGEHGMALHDAGMILTFVSLGKWLESLARGRASSAIQKLVGLVPTDTTVVRNGQSTRARVSDVKLGETILVLPGERVPLDAEIISGTSLVNQAWLTGESLPVTRSVGELVLAGSINGNAALQARVIRDATQSGLAQVVQLVRRAQESRANIQRLADVVVAWFVPFVLALAALTLAIWTMIRDVSTGLEFAVAVLVVACPCALGLATPTAILVASGIGAELGILIKDAQSIETAERISTVLLDKTGTITTGEPAVVELAVRKGMEPNDILRFAAALEAQSNHPLAKAIVQSANERQLTWELATGVTQIIGQGVVGTYADAHSPGQQRIVMGAERFLLDHGITLPAESAAVVARSREMGRTPVVIAVDGEVAGVIVLADQVRSTSPLGIQQLHELGLRPVLLTGDTQETAEGVAKSLSIADFRAEVSPQEKHNVVEEFRRQGNLVAMIGDGINDAAALAAADLGIAIGTGADVAIEAADIVLMRPDLRDAATAIRLARRTLRTIRQNLFSAFIYNVVLLPLAAGLFVPIFGWRLPPSWAAAAMALSSVSVVSNSLMLRRWFCATSDPHKPASTV